MDNTSLAEPGPNPPMPAASAVADVTGHEGRAGEGPFMRLHLWIEGQSIREARFETYGCPVAIRCGNWVSQWVMGRTVAQAGVLEAGDLLVVLGGVPLGKEHCASLAVNALQDALRRWQAASGPAEQGKMT